MTTPPLAAITPGTVPAASAPAANDRARLHQAAQSFEAIFVRQMLASARSANFGDTLWGEDPGHDTFGAMRDEHTADIMAKSGSLGLAQQIEAQLGTRLGSGGGQ